MKKIFYAIIFLILTHYFNIFCNSENKIIFELKPIKDKNGALSQNFMKELINFFQVNVLVETGTYIGDTVFNAIPLFNNIYTMELSNQLYNAACDRFKNNKNVHLFCGDSANILPEILPIIQNKILFWLDAHCSGGNTAGQGVPIPLSKEAEAIRNSNVHDAIILIDDMRGFSGNYAKEIDLSSLREKILKINPSYQFIIFGDTAIAFLPDERIKPSPLLYALTISRLFDFEESLNLNDLFDAEEVIASITGEERDSLLELTKLENGYYYFWKGLILLKENCFEEAMTEFKSSLKWGPNHWRIYWYWAQSAYQSGDNKRALELIQNVLSSAPSFKQAENFYNLLIGK